MADGATGAQLWTRHYPADPPEIRQSEDGALVMILPVSADPAQQDINHPKAKLFKRSDWMNEWVSHAYFVEVVEEVGRSEKQPDRNGFPMSFDP